MSPQSDERLRDVIFSTTLGRFAGADGATLTQITARITQEMPVLQRSILFTTTAGSFGLPQPTQTARTAGSDGVATVQLTSPREPSVAVVTAIVNNIQSATTVTFVPALPDRIALSVFGSLQLEASFATKVPLEAKLERFLGQVTPGTEIVLRAVDESTGTAFGFFSGVTLSDASGRVTAQFTPGNTTERGEATIGARVPGTEISGRVRIEIVNP